MRFGIGQPVSRKEDGRFLTGQRQYVADIELAHQAYAVLVYSPHSHARFHSIDKRRRGRPAFRLRNSCLPSAPSGTEPASWSPTGHRTSHKASQTNQRNVGTRRLYLPRLQLVRFS